MDHPISLTAQSLFSRLSSVTTINSFLFYFILIASMILLRKLFPFFLYFLKYLTSRNNDIAKSKSNFMKVPIIEEEEEKINLPENKYPISSNIEIEQKFVENYRKEPTSNSRDLEKLIKNKQYLEGYSTYKEIIEAGKSSSEIFEIYIRGLKEASKEGNIIRIQAIESAILDIKASINIPSTNTMNDILEITNNQKENSWMYYCMLKELKGKPDIYTFQLLIKKYNQDPNSVPLNELEKEINQYIIDNPKSGFILSNSLLDLCIKNGDLEKSEKLFESLETKDSFAFSNMISLYCKKQLLEKAFSIYDYMESKGIIPEEIAISNLYENSLKYGKYEKAIQIYDRMETLNREITSAQGTSMIQIFSKLKKFDSAYRIFEFLLKKDALSFNNYPFNAMLDCCIYCGRYDVLLHLYEIVVSNSKQEIKADIISYSTFIKGFCRMKRMDAAIALYNRLISLGIELDEIFFNTLLDGFAKSNIPNEALKIIDDMNKLKIKKSNYTYSILVKIYTSSRRIDLALHILDEMKISGITPSVIVYTCLIQACIKSKQIDKGVSIFHEMVKADIKPDIVLYNTIINGCIFSGKLVTGCTILTRSMNEKLILATDIYNNVLKNLLMKTNVSISLRHSFASQICNFIQMNKIGVDYNLFMNVLTFSYSQPNLIQNQYENQQFPFHSNIYSNHRKY